MLNIEVKNYQVLERGMYKAGEGNGTPLQYSCLENPMEEPGRLQYMGSLRIGHDWATSLSLFIFMHWRRKWQPTPVFLPGESQGRGILVGCRPWGRTESDTTEVTQHVQGNFLIFNLTLTHLFHYPVPPVKTKFTAPVNLIKLQKAQLLHFYSSSLLLNYICI